MTKTNLRRDTGWKLYRPLIATALAVGGTLHMVGAVLADGTAAGVSISNTATATYEDENGDTIDATSNTVTVEVGEVPGLTVVPAGIDDQDGGSVEAGDEVHFDFDITNVGNYPTDVFIPGVEDLTPTNFIPTEIEIFDSQGTSLGSINLGDGGQILNDGALALDLDPNNLSASGVDLPPDEKITIRVKGTVPTTGVTAGQPVGVRIGDTGPNDNSALSQNQDDNNPPEGVADNPTQDIRTVDPDPTDDSDNPESEREGSATQEVPFAASVRPLALAEVLKTAVGFDDKGDAVLTNDEITYELGLKVEDTDPSGQFQPSALEGTTINLDGANVQRILVSDAIPDETTLQGASLSLPPGWEVVYTNAPLTIAATDPTAAWQSGPLPSDATALGNVTRIGFVYSGTLAQGVTVNGLQFTVTVTDPETGTDYTVENIAQVFGETVGDPNNDIVYDESGDANPNNFPDNASPTNLPTDPNGGYDPAADFGVAPESDPGNDGTIDNPGDFDVNNDNTGTGDNGEPNVVQPVNTITPPADATGLLNGPENQPGASYNTTNDDFTNLSATDIPPNLDPATPYDPAPVSFTNTVDNSNSDGFIATVGLEPISPNQAAALDPSGDFGDLTIPDLTTVTINYLGADGVVGGTGDDADQTATYTYNAGSDSFALTAGTPVNVGDIYATDAPIDYEVIIDATNTTQLDSIPVPILSFSDDNPNPTSPNAGYNANNAGGQDPELTTNITVDRLYIGFMDLLKEARISDSAGNLREDWTANPTLDVVPGDTIDYRITYRNISEELAGSGNVGLNANNFVIIEDGAAGSNNWGAVTSHVNGYMDFAGIVEYYDSADTLIGNIDPATGTEVAEYQNDVGIVFPGRDGIFVFRRVVD